MRRWHGYRTTSWLHPNAHVPYLSWRLQIEWTMNIEALNIDWRMHLNVVKSRCIYKTEVTYCDVHAFGLELFPAVPMHVGIYVQWQLQNEIEENTTSNSKVSFEDRKKQCKVMDGYLRKTKVGALLNVIKLALHYNTEMSFYIWNILLTTLNEVLPEQYFKFWK